jgi:aspartyl-tRNA(Asn)/glutamyl-tRNA(Gln) amidotransferase subunit C
MALSLSDIHRVAHLARIETSTAEAEATLKSLTGVFALIEEMQAVNTDGIEPMSHGIDVTQRLREDRVTETNQRERNQQPAGARVDNGLYLVPKVIE